jgi:hypothetical protein
LRKTEDGEVTPRQILFNGERINGMNLDKIVRRGSVGSEHEVSDHASHFLDKTIMEKNGSGKR